MKIHWQVLKGKNEAPWLLLDLALLFLISINLAWLLLDAILLNSGSGVMLARTFPDFIRHYREHWHTSLQIYDSFFTFFLIGELLLRWLHAIWNKTYYRWFFYPFVRWYDVLGCIPLPAFRALRLLRLISIGYRLQKLGVIDLSESSPFVAGYKYYRIVIEELSDRIVVNVLNGVQKEVREGGQLTHRLSEEVLKPHRDSIVPWLATLLSQTTAHAHGSHQRQLGRYLDSTVRRAVAENPDLQKLKRRLLFAGPAVEEELQLVVSGLLTRILDDVLRDMAQPGNAAAKDIAGGLFDTLNTSHADMNETLRSILLEAIELIKLQVSVQQWKDDEQELGKSTPGE
ncbi:MAG: hypothetical protein ACRERR_12260 [Moraxellaceae bacterium]